MRLAIKLLLGSAVAALAGGAMLIDGLMNGTLNQIVGGMLWKGPLLMAVGVAGVFMGIRMLNDKDIHGNNDGGDEP